MPALLPAAASQLGEGFRLGCIDILVSGLPCGCGAAPCLPRLQAVEQLYDSEEEATPKIGMMGTVKRWFTRGAPAMCVVLVLQQPRMVAMVPAVQPVPQPVSHSLNK